MSRYSASVGREAKSAASTTKHKKEKETRLKNDILVGWKVSDVHEEYDIVHWAKRKEHQESKQVSEKKSSQVKWDQYVGSIIRKCRSVDNVQMFIDNSLSIALKPVPSHLEKEPVKVKLKHSLSSLQLNNEKHPVIKEANEITEAEKNNIKDNLNSSKVRNATSKQSEEFGNSDTKAYSKSNDRDTHSSEPRENSRTEINDKTLDGSKNDNEDISDRKDDDISDQSKNSKDSEKNVVDNIAGLLETRSEAFSETASTIEEKTERSIDKPVPKFGYTNANISLGRVHLYDTQDGEEESGITISPLEQKHLKRNSKLNRTLHTTNLTNIPLVPGYVNLRTKSGGTKKERILTSKSESNIHSANEEDEAMPVKKRIGDTDLAGMTVASIRTTRRLGSARGGRSHSEQLLQYNGEEEIVEKQQPHMSQKQVLLVLKNVTLKDGFDDYQNNYLSPRTLTNLTTSGNTNGFKQIENLIQRASSKVNNKQLDHSLEHPGRTHNSPYFPLADLLPAVDNSIKNSMPARYVRSIDNLGFTRMETEHVPKSSMVIKEDKIFNVNDDMVQNNNTLGRPTFRPPKSKTPLQRAQENTKKRLDSSSLSQNAQQMSDMNDKAKWLSSPTSLPNSKQFSRPGSTDESLMIKQDKSSSGEDRAVTPIPYCIRRYRSPPWQNKLSRKHKHDLIGDSDPHRTQLQQVSKALSSRLQDMARQRSGQRRQEVYDKSPMA